MLFSQSIPDKVLETPTTQGFIDVLDRLHVYKTEEISRSLRVYNPILCPLNKWLSALLGDYGIKNIPADYPIAPLQQVLLNIEFIRRLCGSKLGVEAALSAFTLGEVSVDDSRFIRGLPLLYPDDSVNGYITSGNIGSVFYLCSNNNELLSGTYLDITIRSMYFNTELFPDGGAPIKEFLKGFIDSYIGFQDKSTITWTFIGEGITTPYYHKRLNQFFTI